jgi:hypothetical protein
MKLPLRLSFLIVLIFLFPLITNAQTVTVTPKKVVYKRTGRNVDKYKREFEVRYPVFTGVSASTLKNLKHNTDYWRLFEMSLAENLKDDTWLSSFDYQIKYNKNSLLAIWLTEEGVGAYPDSSSKYLVLDTKTGNEVHIEDLFSTSQLAGLRDMIRRKMRARETALGRDKKWALKDNRENSPDEYPTPERLELKNLAGFSVSDSGVIFIYKYEYPFGMKALEPSGNFSFTYAELRPYIRRDGLLARFIR